MRETRRMIGCLLALSCVITALSGCGNLLGKTEESTFSITINTPENTIEDTEETTNREALETTETTKESEEEVAVLDSTDNKEFLSLSISYLNDCKYGVDYYDKEYEIQYQKIFLNSNTMFQGPMIMKEDAPELSDVLDELNKDEEQIAANYLESFQELLQDGYDYSFTYRSDLYVQRADKHVLSILNRYSDYTGGTHGLSGKIGKNYDPETGKKLMLTDVITNTERLAAMLHADLVTNHPDFLFGDPMDTIENAISDNSLSWTIGYDRVTVYFQEYQVAAYAAGVIAVELPFAQYPELFNSKYLDVPESYAVQIPITEPSQEEYYYDLDGDGQFESIIPSYDINEYGDMSSVWVTVDGQKASTECEAYETQATIIHMPDEKNYLYMETSEIDDYRNTYVFELSKTPRYIDSTYGISTLGYQLDETQVLYTLITDPANVELETSSGIVGTHDIYKTYYIKDDGMPASYDTEYAFFTTHFQITSKIALSLQDKNGKQVTLPAGTVFDVLYTDNEAKVGLRTGSKEYILTFEQIKDPEFGYVNLEIDGKSVSDVFDGIIYAG